MTPATARLAVRPAPSSMCPAMLVVLAVTALLVVGVRESARVNSVIVVIKLVIIVGVHRRRRRVRQHGALGDRQQTRRAISFRPISAPANSAGAACCAAPPWCSSPISASTPSRPRRRRPSNPQRDMPIGILGSLVDLHGALRRGRLRADRHRAPTTGSTWPTRSPSASTRSAWAGCRRSSSSASSSA